MENIAMCWCSDRMERKEFSQILHVMEGPQKEAANKSVLYVFS